MNPHENTKHELQARRTALLLHYELMMDRRRKNGAHGDYAGSIQRRFGC